MQRKNSFKQTKTVLTASLSMLALASFAFSLQACSLFSMKSEEQTDPTFHATASSNQMPTVFPVEIADDINKLAKGEAVDPSQGWKKTEVAADDEDESDEAPGDDISVSFKRGPASVTPPMKFKREGANRVYTVRHGDTLMKISYEAFGNVYRWREIYEKNKGKIANYNAVPVGTVLTINGVEYVKIERNGIPYLIRRHDTLTKISKGLYGTPTYWKNLWANNRMLIHDPNKIYAGFTLYYKEKPSQMGLAKQELPQKSKAEISLKPQAEAVAAVDSAVDKKTNWKINAKAEPVPKTEPGATLEPNDVDRNVSSEE